MSVRDGDLEHRFVGLLASGAYRQSVLSIPTVGDRALAVLGLVDAGAETHTGRSIRNTLETLPRDLVFELDADRLAHLVIDIVGLQERQLVRIFDVAEPVGAWSTVLVYLPRTRFTARLPELVAEAVASTYGSSYRDLESLVGASTLARITLSVRRPDGPPPDLDRLADVVDELTISWDDRLRTVLTQELGAVAGRALYERVGLHAPADFRANVTPAQAVADLERIDRLLASGDGLTTAMNHDEGAPPDEWRFRVYRRGEPAALSDLLPLLGHLGLVALDERPSTFVIGDEQVHLYDIGVRVPPGTDVGVRQAEIQSTFEALMAGEVEADGFNRLVSLAGLTARQVSVLRAYAKYLRQIGFAFSQGYIEDTCSRLPHVASSLVELFESKFEPGLDDREAARRRGAWPAGDRPRCDPTPRRRSHLPGVHDADRRDGAHQLLPRKADALVQARPGRDPRPAATAPDVRDLRVLTAGRGRAPARRADRAWWDPVERPPRGLPHRGARSRQGRRW